MTGFSVLGSGSKGNSTLVESSGSHILVDAGFSAVDTDRRLGRIGKSLGDIDAIVISHPHGDHVKGVAPILKQCGDIPVYISAKTKAQLELDREKNIRQEACRLLDIDSLCVFETGSKFDVGKMTVDPFPISHDAADPCGFSVSGEGIDIVIALDTGCFTPALVRAINSSMGAVLESNYSEMLIDNSVYPEFAKTRVRSNLGHLSNEQVEKFILEEFTGNPIHLVLAHVSENTNAANLPGITANGALKKRGFSWIDVKVARQDRPIKMIKF
jgi:phosphoribosyl 1,2-cyclic phosphodiesterase